MITVHETLKEIRQAESFKYAREINKPHGVLDGVIEWCKENFSSEWRWQLIQVSSDIAPGRYIFYFDSEKEYLAFVMKWA